MNFKKCLRCGCFFSSVADISKGTGIDESKINRFMNNKDFIKAVKKEKNNIDINL